MVLSAVDLTAVKLGSFNSSPNCFLKISVVFKSRSAKAVLYSSSFEIMPFVELGRSKLLRSPIDSSKALVILLLSIVLKDSRSITSFFWPEYFLISAPCFLSNDLATSSEALAISPAPYWSNKSFTASIR